MSTPPRRPIANKSRSAQGKAKGVLAALLQAEAARVEGLVPDAAFDEVRGLGVGGWGWQRRTGRQGLGASQLASWL